MAGYNNNYYYYYNRGSALCLNDVLFIGASNYPIAAQAARGLNLNGLFVNGSLCWTPTGNCQGQGQGLGLPNVPVRLACINDTTVDASQLSQPPRTRMEDLTSQLKIYMGCTLAGLQFHVTLVFSSQSTQSSAPHLTTHLTSNLHSLETLINSTFGYVLSAALDGFVVKAEA